MNRFIAAGAMVMVLTSFFLTGCNQTNQPEPVLESPASSSQDIVQTARDVPKTTTEMFQKWEDFGIVGDQDESQIITNAQLAAILNRIIEYRGEYTRYFEDLRDTDWYYDDLMSMAALCLMEGSGGLALPEAEVSRETAITVIANAFLYDIPMTGTTGFADNDKLSSWARGACFAMEERGYLTTFGAILEPEKAITKGELLQILDAMVNDIVDKPMTLSGSYPQGLIIACDGVTIENAEITGNVYVKTGVTGLEIKDTEISGGLVLGLYDQGEKTVALNQVSVGAIVINEPCNLSIGGQVESIYGQEMANIFLDNTSVIGTLYAQKSQSVTGRGMLSFAVIGPDAGNTSFEVLPAGYIDVPNGTYAGDNPYGFITIGQNTYCVDINNSLMFGFVVTGTDEYYFAEDGTMATGLRAIGEKTYYFGDDGILQRGWVIQDGLTYYFDAGGVMTTGIAKIGNNSYYFDESGVLETGLFETGGKLYLAGSDGALALGLVTIGEKTYLADESGMLLTGYQELGGITYYFDPETGAMLRDTEIDGEVIGEDGAVQNGPISTGSAALDAELDSILSEITDSSMTLDDKMYAAYKWVGNNIRYRTTPIDTSNGYTQALLIEQINNTLETRRGACEHYAMLVAALFGRLGVETMLIDGQRYSTETGAWGEHTWTLAKVDGKWYHFDTLYESLHTLVPRSCYMKMDAEMESHHTWNRDLYPACEG